MTDWQPFTITPEPVTLTIGADMWPLVGWKPGADKMHRIARTGGGELVTLVVWVEEGERRGCVCIGDATYDLRALAFGDGITGDAKYSPPDQWYLDFVARLSRAVSA